MSLKDCSLGISTAGFEPAGILDNIDLFDKYNVRRVEIFTRGPESSNHFDYRTSGHSAKLVKLLEKYDIIASSFHAPFVEKLLINPETGKIAEAEIFLAMDRAIEIRAGILVLHFLIPESAENDCAFRSLDKILNRAGKAGIKIAIENGVSPMNSVDAITNLLQKLECPALGICLDTSHVCMLEGADKLAEVVRKCGKHLMTLHVSDGDEKGDRHWVPGDRRGKINWPKFIAALEEVCYSNVFMCEPVEGHAARDGIDDFIKRTVANAKNIFPMLNYAEGKRPIRI